MVTGTGYLHKGLLRYGLIGLQHKQFLTLKSTYRHEINENRESFHQRHSPKYGRNPKISQDIGSSGPAPSSQYPADSSSNEPEESQGWSIVPTEWAMAMGRCRLPETPGLIQWMGSDTAVFICIIAGGVAFWFFIRSKITLIRIGGFGIAAKSINKQQVRFLTCICSANHIQTAFRSAHQIRVEFSSRHTTFLLTVEAKLKVQFVWLSPYEVQFKSWRQIGTQRQGFFRTPRGRSGWMQQPHVLRFRVYSAAEPLESPIFAATSER